MNPFEMFNYILTNYRAGTYVAVCLGFLLAFMVMLTINILKK